MHARAHLVGTKSQALYELHFCSLSWSRRETGSHKWFIVQSELGWDLNLYTPGWQEGLNLWFLSFQLLWGPSSSVCFVSFCSCTSIHLGSIYWEPQWAGHCSTWQRKFTQGPGVFSLRLARQISGTGQIAQFKVLTTKAWGSELDSQNPDHFFKVRLTISVLGKQRQAALWGLLARQPSSFSRFPARERPSPKVKSRQN